MDRDPHARPEAIFSEQEIRLFDLEKDPGERVDIAPTDAATVARLRAQLDESLGQVQLSSGEAEQLKALGY